jgi:histidinol-phosphate aminotransferase
MSDAQAVIALARPAIRQLQAYSHAQWDPQLDRLHANESPWLPAGQDDTLCLNRYPEPQPETLWDALARHYQVLPSQIVVGRGSDEIIDLLTRVFCEAGRDAVTVCPPTFGMYAVAAQVQGGRVISAPLQLGFSLNVSLIEQSLAAGSKLIWLCSPNNPTGNQMTDSAIQSVIELAKGRAIVVLDEAYAEFTADSPWPHQVLTQPHLVILRTLSKAHGLAGIRLGTLIAHPALAALVRKIIPPYAVSQPTCTAALHALQPSVLAITRERIATLIKERERVRESLAHSPWIQVIYPSAANFLLVATEAPDIVMQRAKASGLLLRDFSERDGLGGAVRISIGTPEQNNRLLQALQAQA